MFGKLTQLPPREQAGLALACAALLLLGTDSFVVRPIALELKRMDAEISAAKEEVKDNRLALRYKDSVEKQYEEVKNLIGVSKNEQEGLNFKGDIDDMAPRNGIKVKSRKLLEPVPTDFLETYFVSIGGFESDILALIHFLYDMHNAPGLLRVQKLTINSQVPNTMVSGSMVISKAMTLAEKQE
jgi:hypothetical protein